ncbi:glycosyltransferase family 4 protein [Paenibacillus sp. KQZ6P-2]|uniref:Glycosyltransferase family 4 protein n=1 Tax=Paenibacillus mangrovi TaxID=2931978 RepID=A0A9X1WW64_9BACL|nr:glycosyltransferase family 4 protein [Paenibacillus mangrovi]MCJ8014668.1 glycosyltransferase family 4 protein [Paenibacillus mangrovi]
MKILIVAPEQLPVPGSGSVEICILAIAQQLAQNHKVTVVSRASNGMPFQSTINRVKIVRVSSESSEVYLASVLRFIQGSSYDVIQVDNRPHYMASIKNMYPQMKVTLFLHSLTFVPHTRHIANSLKYADLIIANSNSLMHELIVRFPSQAHKIRTVELGVDIITFTPPSESERSEARQKYGIGNRFTVLFVGRIIPRKGVPVLLRAVYLARKQVPLHLIIAGKGRASYLRKLRMQAKKLGVPVTWLGKQDHSEIHRIYQMADCFVCPSQKHEAFGLVNVEAMATGLPVIASRIGGIPEIVKHGSNGYLVDAYRHPSRFAKYLIRLEKNRELQCTLGNNGRSTVLQHFTWSQTASKIVSLYSQATRSEV